MKKKILVGVILISVLASIAVAIGRIKVEQSSPNVEIVLDWESFADFQEAVKRPEAQLLQRLEDAGVQSVALYEKTLKDYEKGNELVILEPKDLLGQYYLAANPSSPAQKLYQGQADLQNFYILFQDAPTYESVSRQLQLLPGNLIKDTYIDAEKGVYILEVANPHGKLDTLPLGFSERELKLIADMGLNLVPRFSNTRERLTALKPVLLDLKARFTISEVIFDGLEVPGYPDKIDATAIVFNEADVQIGMIEPFIAYQDGIKELAVKTDLNIVRVHSIKADEVEKYTYPKVLDRYVRAVKERNVRVLYYKPFLTGKGKLEALPLNLRFLKDIKSDLTQSGYQMGIPTAFTNDRTGILWVLIIGLGVFAAGLLLVDKFIILPDWVHYLLLSLGVVGTLGIMLKGQVLLAREMLALAAGIVLPSLAVITGYEQAKAKDAQGRLNFSSMLIFLRATAITLAGVFLITGLLSDARYLYQVNQFRGIKFTFILPLLIIFVYYMRRLVMADKLRDYLRILSKGVQVLNQPVRYLHLLLLAFAAVVAILYIGRTGNEPMLPISGLEVKLREWLEDFFVFRPRFKEFAIGHPFLLLAFYYILRGKDKYLLPLLIVGAFGQITIINTFSHIHTPVMVSGIRVLLAVILGVILGFVLVWIYRWMENQIKKYGRYFNE